MNLKFYLFLINTIFLTQGLNAQSDSIPVLTNDFVIDSLAFTINVDSEVVIGLSFSEVNESEMVTTMSSNNSEESGINFAPIQVQVSLEDTANVSIIFIDVIEMESGQVLLNSKIITQEELNELNVEGDHLQIDLGNYQVGLVYRISVTLEYSDGRLGVTSHNFYEL